MRRVTEVVALVEEYGRNCLPSCGIVSIKSGNMNSVNDKKAGKKSVVVVAFLLLQEQKNFAHMTHKKIT